MKLYPVSAVFLAALLLLSCSPDRGKRYAKQYEADIEAIRPTVLQFVRKYAASTNWMALEDNRVINYTIEVQKAFSGPNPSVVIAQLTDISERDGRIQITASKVFPYLYLRLECSRELGNKILAVTSQQRDRYHDFAFIIVPTGVSRPIAELSGYVEGKQEEEHAVITTQPTDFTIVTGTCVDAMPLHMSVFRSSDVFRLEKE